MSENKKFVQGNEACVEGALYAGLDFYAGYPITPSTEIAEILSYRLPRIGGKFIQMEDEIASLCAIIGASLTGSKVMTATSGPGFSLMQEALGYAVMAEIPCVIVNVQQLPEADARFPLGLTVDEIRTILSGRVEVALIRPGPIQGVRFDQGSQPVPFCRPEDQFNYAADNFLLRPMERTAEVNLAGELESPGRGPLDPGPMVSTQLVSRASSVPASMKALAISCRQALRSTEWARPGATRCRP